MSETPEDRALIIRRMEVASNTFYNSAVFTGCHAFIEFTGLMNEFINLCRAAERQGIDWPHANVHGPIHLPYEHHHIEYLSEKLECIYGKKIKLSDGKETRDAVDECIKIVKARKTHYECYRHKPGETLDQAGMHTHPAVFAILDEVLVFLGALRERLENPPP